MKTSRRLLLVVGVALAVGFAPVPPPRTGVAEAVVNAFGSGPGGVRRALLADLPRTIQAEKVRGLGCLKGEKDPAAWLGKRLHTEEVAPDGPVRLRLDGCRPTEALALLTALVGAYETSHRAARQEVEELVAGGRVRLRVWVAQGGGNAGIALTERSMDQRDGPAVLQRPRLVGTSTAR